ncbi:serine/threonine protein kinase [Pelagibacteraceae bacterium]|nr:serine/threonine protein kinase [Pelagibacteraceae bacterium]|tara:strand:+ start:251 stop:1354 length:1104 start_codon:yes stop_codon:yes gene_type:complete
MTIVNSWNEWDQLKHVIVGKVDYANVPPMEPALEPKISKDSGMIGSHGPRPIESIEKANLQLENFVKILNSLNITVDRPEPIDFSQSIQTPDWFNDGMFGCMPPRDVILTVGNEMLEAPMSYRCRWFEYLAYRPLLEKYYKEDKNMRWESAPKPRLTDSSYKSNYLPDGITEEERYKKIENRDMILTEKEPLFDAAEILRFGKDLFYHNNFTSNLSGLDWLQRHFPNHRVHQINLPGDLIPTHIDACLTPIKPGLMIINPNRKLSSEQKEIFDKNKWEIHEAAPSIHNTPPPMCYSSIWLSMNVLIINPKTICVEASEEKMIKQMEGFGMEVIPVPFRDAYAFGGSLHCATTDVYRDGECEDYFPNQ